MTAVLVFDRDVPRGAAPLRLLVAGRRLLALDELWTRSLENDEVKSAEDAAVLRLVAAEMTALLTECERLVPIVIEQLGQSAESLDRELDRKMPGAARFTDEVNRVRGVAASRGGLTAFGIESANAFLGLVAAEREQLIEKMAWLDSGSSPEGDISHDGQCAILGALFVVAASTAPAAAIGIGAMALVGEECF